MLDFKIEVDPQTKQKYLATSISGKPLLTIPQLNKGTAFTPQEREAFNLTGKLPTQIEPLAEQVRRAYKQYQAFIAELKKNIYLSNLHDKNQVLFYKLVSKHLEEILPTIYTPYVSHAIENYSVEFRNPRGLYIAYPDRGKIPDILDNRSNPEIDLIVVTDGESILGIGDQGVGGMGIPVAKLIMYTLCGGIDPNRTLPIFLDVGTNNPQLLNHPFYLGLKHKRITGKDYFDFIDEFIQAIQKRFPHVFLHWEDFAGNNAQTILNRYYDKLCTFNDDIQGTGIVTLAALLAACKATDSSLADQRIVIFGAGAAGTGIADHVQQALVRMGLSTQQACRTLWLLDKQGLLLQNDTQLTASQKPYARDPQEISSWQLADNNYISLTDTVTNLKPTILIGCAACANAFDQTIIQTMAANNERPIIFPLSNPTERCEATPQQIIEWTQGKALVATGTAFPPVAYAGTTFSIAQCNNVLTFPGLGLGLLAVGSRRLNDDMLWAAVQVISNAAPINTNPHGALLPSLTDAQQLAKNIAYQVATVSIEQGHARKNTNADLNQVIEQLFWHPDYLPYRRII